MFKSSDIVNGKEVFELDFGIEIYYTIVELEPNRFELMSKRYNTNSFDIPKTKLGLLRYLKKYKFQK